MFAAAAARYGSGMRITCPACASVYDVPDSRIVPGRAVRCARCGTDWVPQVEAVLVLDPVPAVALDVTPVAERIVEEPPAPVPIAAEVPVETPAAPVSPPPRRSRRGVLAVAWVASFAVLGAAGASVVHWRAGIMQAWPPSERLYAVLGLLPNGQMRPSGPPPDGRLH